MWIYYILSLNGRFGVAASTYWDLCERSVDQAVIFNGESGSGKTGTNTWTFFFVRNQGKNGVLWQRMSSWSSTRSLLWPITPMSRKKSTSNYSSSTKCLKVRNCTPSEHADCRSTDNLPRQTFFLVWLTLQSHDGFVGRSEAGSFKSALLQFVALPSKVWSSFAQKPSVQIIPNFAVTMELPSYKKWWNQFWEEIPWWFLGFFKVLNFRKLSHRCLWERSQMCMGFCFGFQRLPFTVVLVGVGVVHLAAVFVMEPHRKSFENVRGNQVSSTKLPKEPYPRVPTQQSGQRRALQSSLLRLRKRV